MTVADSDTEDFICANVFEEITRAKSSYGTCDEVGRAKNSYGMSSGKILRINRLV